MPARPTLPPKGKGTANQLKAFLDRVLMRDTAYRIDRFRIWEQARHYYAGNQWLEPDYTDDPTRTPFFKAIEVDQSNWMPMPVRNIMVAPIQNEVARLVGAGSRPYVRVEDDDPKSEKAAQLGRDVLLDSLERVHWTETEHEGCHQLVTYGTWTIKAYWDIDFTKTVKIPVTTGLKCPGCDFRLAEPSVPEDQVRGRLLDPDFQARVDVRTIGDPNNNLVPPKFKVKATHCLECDAVAPAPMQDETGAPMVDEMGQQVMSEGQPIPELRPWIPSDDEAKRRMDAFGRPLGEEVPLGDVELRNVPCFDYFPQNGGLQVNSRTCLEHGEEHIETLEWIRAHYKNGDKVEAEDSETLMRWHPIVGGSAHYLGGAGGDAEPNLLAESARVREFHKEPFLELVDGKVKKNLGRSIVMAGNVILLDADYLIPSETNPGEFIPRITYYSTPWELRDGELWGLSASELMFSIQDSFNTRRGQVEDARHRFGSPKLLAVDGMDLMYAGFTDTGYNSDIWYYRPVEGASQQEPKPFGNDQMTQEWVQEEKLDLEAVAQITGTMDVEIGNVPSGVTAASAMMFMGEKASERRKTRVSRLLAMKRRIFTAILVMIHEKYREKRYYHVRGKNDRWGVKSFMGADLLNQTNVMVDEEPAYNLAQFKRESIKEGLTIYHTISADTDGAKRKINKALGIPTDINDDRNRQVELAEEEFMRFYEEGIRPVVKMREDVHQIHYETHVLDWLAEDASRIRDEVDWNQIELALWGWEEDYDALEAAEQDLKLNPIAAGPMKAMPGPDGNVDPAAQQHADEMFAQRQQMAQQIAALPKAPELRMVIMWQKKLAGVQPPLFGPPQDPTVQYDQERDQKVTQLFVWKAHFETHYRAAKAQAQAAAGGMMMPASPGGPETPAGMMPSGRGPVAPGPGAGAGATTASGSSGMAA